MPGTILVGRVEAEANGHDLHVYDYREGYSIGVTSPERVYFSSDREFARAYAGLLRVADAETGVVFQHGSLYEVEPLGEAETDPDFNGDVSWCATRARIVAVEEVNVSLSPYEVTQRVGPYSSWKDGSAIYRPDGRYIPSPEQIALTPPDVLTAMSEALFPWTPVPFINAWIEGKPAGDRPDPAEIPNILLRAGEGGHVTARHRARAKALEDLNITFTNDSRPHLPDVNRLLQLAGPTQVSPDDKRGVVVALHQQEGVIGAIVFTAARFGSHVATFADSVVVAPSWRGHGVGSVMLLTAQQLLPAAPSLSAGHCDPQVAGFFAQLGFTVLKPGVELVLPLGPQPHVVDVGSDHCGFYRQGPV